MKKFIKVLICCLICQHINMPIITFAQEQPKQEKLGDLTPNAAAAYLMEYSSGKVIYSKQEHQKLYPASMTKMMGLLIIFEHLNKGKLKWDDEVVTSEFAASMGGSQVFLEPNETMSVKDMIKSICIASANDAMVAMAEKIAGTHDNFVQMMNEKANQLQLKNTHFMNATGLHDEQHFTTAYDMATIARHLIQEGKQDLLDITSTYDAYIRENSKQKFWLVNTNKLLKQYPGVDGLKTGFTQEAMSCISVTAKKNGLRLIAVVMKEPDSKIRNQEIKTLLDYGFSQYESQVIYTKNSLMDSITMDYAKPSKVNLYLKEDLIYVHLKGEQAKERSKKIEVLKKELPYKKNEAVAKLIIEMEDGIILEEELFVKEDINALSFMDILWKTWKNLIA